jgi:hypothetical protein
MVTLCLAGPEAERKFRCSINDGSDRVDYEMAREYLARRVATPAVEKLTLVLEGLQCGQNSFQIAN